MIYTLRFISMICLSLFIYVIKPIFYSIILISKFLFFLKIDDKVLKKIKPKKYLDYSKIDIVFVNFIVYLIPFIILMSQLIPNDYTNKILYYVVLFILSPILYGIVGIMISMMFEGYFKRLSESYCYYKNVWYYLTKKYERIFDSREDLNNYIQELELEKEENDNRFENCED